MTGAGPGMMRLPVFRTLFLNVPTQTFPCSLLDEVVSLYWPCLLPLFFGSDPRFFSLDSASRYLGDGFFIFLFPHGVWTHLTGSVMHR